MIIHQLLSIIMPTLDNLMLSLRLLVLVLLMPAGPSLFLLIRDKSLQLKSFCVVDVLCLGWRPCMAVRAGGLGACAVFSVDVVVIGLSFGGFGPCVDGVNVEKDVHD